MSSNIKLAFRKNYEDLSDDEIIRLINDGDKDAENYLLGKYKTLVNVKANRFYLTGADRDDIVQEGMIGLYKAVQSYSFDKNSSFKTFANLCINRQLITALKTSNRQKHIPLNSSLSLNNTAFTTTDDDETALIEVLDFGIVEDPLDTITAKEHQDYLEKTIYSNLSDFEKKVLEKYIEGDSYVNIAEKLCSPVKSVDNAIQRIRKKAIKCIGDE